MSQQTATLKITGVRIETLKALETNARALGKSVDEYACELIETGLAALEPTFDEILAPIRREVEESGITDEELDELFMEARRDYFREQQERLNSAKLTL